MSKVKELFESYGGDYAGTKTHFMENDALYLHLLDVLFKEQSLQWLEASLKEKDLSNAFAAAHTLKGIVGNMGLTSLFKAISDIVEPLRAEDSEADYETLFQRVKEEHEKADKLLACLNGRDE